MTIPKWDEYHNTEKPTLDLLHELGYIYREGKDLTHESSIPERSSFREVILSNRFVKKIKEFNPWISESNIKQVIRKLTIPTIPSQIEINELIWQYLTKPSKLVVEQDLDDGKGRRNHWVKLIDWNNIENNEYLVSNQFKINASKGYRIPDIVVFINGLPLVVIECKSPFLTNPLQQGIKQVIEYQETIPKLFYFNQITIVTSSQSAKYGVIGNSYMHYREWKEPFPITLKELEKIITRTGRSTPNPNRQDILLYGLLEPRNLLDLIHNFIIYERERGRIIKKLARYQQFRAVNKTIERIITEEDPSQRGGTIWHTQGSGKSHTMLFTAVKLRREKKLNNPLLLFICDRIDLVKQLNGIFENCGFPNPIEPKSAKDLQKLIRLGQGITLFTTLQKFRTEDADKETGDSKIGIEFPELNPDKNIFVLIDEAHRSQYQIFASNMRKGLPNGCFIAYTGTPLARNERKQLISVGKGKTVKKFGKFIDVYDMRQSVEDNMTVEIFYENRLPELQVEGESIDDIFNRVFSEKTQKEQEAIKKKYATKDKILAAPERIKKVVLDILTHFEERINQNGFKAQVVVSSRELAVLYKKYFEQFNAPESVVIISANPRYDDELKKHGVPFITNKSEQQTQIARFNDPDDPLKSLIVCDMLITGFDAPIEQVMYLDKSLREHNLLQAIARVNRTYERKVYGLVVDYYGVSQNLEEALNIFDKADIEGFMKHIDDELPRLEQRYRAVIEYFTGVDMNDLEACMEVIEPENKRADFRADFKKFSESLDIVLPDPGAQPYIFDLQRLGKIIASARNRFRDEDLDIADCGPKVKQIIDEHIRTYGVKQLVEPVPILSEKFQEVLDGLKSDKARASEMQHAISHEISVKIEEDPICYTSLKERLERIIEEYTQNRIDLAEKIKHLKAIVAELKDRPILAKKMGLNQDELAFYNLIKKDLNDLGVIEERDIIKATYEILESIEPHVTLIDWHMKLNVIKNIRRDSKLILGKKGIKQPRLNQIAQKIVDLAKVHFK